MGQTSWNTHLCKAADKLKKDAMAQFTRRSKPGTGNRRIQIRKYATAYDD
jgi:hypothetical protein